MNVSRSVFQKIFVYILSAALVVTMAASFLPTVQADEFRSSTDVKLVVNGTPVSSDVAPIIINERTMIPARAVFEQLGGTVSWNEASQQVTVQLGGHTVVLTIQSLNATVDGTLRTMDAVPRLYQGRTLIPIRFVAEALGATVGWDNATRTATINLGGVQPAPAPAAPSTKGSITAVSVTYGTDSNLYTTVKITSSVAMTTSDYSVMSLTGPNRYVVDFTNFAGTSGSLKSFAKNSRSNAVVTGIRTAMHRTDQFRLVCDLSKAATPTIALSGDKKTLFVTFAEVKSSTPAATTPTTPTTTTPTTTKPTTPTTTTPTTSSSTYNPRADKKLVVVLDPGHGASTAGKRSPDGSLREYELNRDIAYRLRDILKANGITVYMTVSDKTSDPSLASRVEYANSKNADIFVSVHANAFGNGVDWEDRAKGWEIYYYATSTVGKKLAQYIHDANFPSSGTNIGISDRGIKTANFYVLKYTSMPAVLIEHGFYTSSTEIKLLKSSTWRQKAAQLDANGIMNFFKSYK